MTLNNFKDETGNKYGLLLVVSRSDKAGPEYTWACLCDCGRFVQVRGSFLRNGHTKSCGCLRVGRIISGLYKHPLRNIHNTMKQRCINPNTVSYKNYGARGISVCEEWLNRRDGLANFIHWATLNGWEDGLTINRIDNDGNYEPGNCNWQTLEEQTRNRRSSIFYEHEGKKLILQDLILVYGNKVKAHTAYSRIKRGWSVVAAVSTPPLR